MFLFVIIRCWGIRCRSDRIEGGTRIHVAGSAQMVQRSMDSIYEIVSDDHVQCLLPIYRYKQDMSYSS
jgi:hypothetical protein